MGLLSRKAKLAGTDPFRGAGSAWAAGGADCLATGVHLAAEGWRLEAIGRGRVPACRYGAGGDGGGGARRVRSPVSKRRQMAVGNGGGGIADVQAGHHSSGFALWNGGGSARFEPQGLALEAGDVVLG